MLLMAGNKKKKRIQLLSVGRPPTAKKPKSISRKSTKMLINKFHVLEKRKMQALARGDTGTAAAIDADIEALGGLRLYQEASLQGQREDRGGDSSRVLVQWLEPYAKSLVGKSLRMLEVGALCATNACAKSGIFEIERIDLSSQADGILQQDFMERPLPRDDSEKFDIVSLSLVLNYVPDAQGRGDMLLRTVKFLHEPPTHGLSSPCGLFPGLFLVLPSPCVNNSRYLDDGRLEAVMNAIGYTKAASKVTQRLVYYLWRRIPDTPHGSFAFTKKEIRPGASRNNFAIVLT